MNTTDTSSLFFKHILIYSVFYLLETIQFTHTHIHTVVRHQVPISQMGNYQEHLKKINPLRELDSGAVRTQLFGNPFKLERPADNKVNKINKNVNSL